MPTQCQHNGCEKQPVYNLPGETTGMYCFTHKAEDMIDVLNKRCQHDGCEKQPNYNLSGETTGMYCFTHKAEDMIDVKVHFSFSSMTIPS
jgi:predicted flavoprotein YhiN